MDTLLLGRPGLRWWCSLTITYPLAHSREDSKPWHLCKASWPQHQQREDRNYCAEYYQHTPNLIDNENLPYTDRFTYLSSVINGDGRTELDIHSCFNKTRNSLNMMNKVWRSSTYSTRTKLKLYHSCVLKSRRSIYHNSPHFTPGAFCVPYASSGQI